MADVYVLKPIGEAEKEEIDVRVLTPDEVESLRPKFVEAKAVFPNPQTSFAVGAVEPGGRVVAFLFIQLQLHAEPMHIEHPHEALFSRLIDTAESELLARVGPCIVYTFTPAGKITRLAEIAGMKLEPWNVMSKIVMTPQKEIV